MKKENVCEEQKLHDPEYITQGQIDKLEAKRTKNYLRSKYDYPRKLETSWKDKRIDAMNRKIKAYPKASKARTEHYLDEYTAVVNSKATCKKEYKKEGLKS